MGLQSSTDAFAPIRGFENTILEATVEHGRVYFSLDTNNVFFDADGKHHQVNGAGITFVYGNATGEGAVPFDSDLERYFFSRDKIVQNHNVTDCYLVGDIIINVNRVEEQAKEFGHSIRREFAFLIAHSMFHLCGYDHMNEHDEKIMFKKQDEVLNNLGITRE